MAAPLDQPSAAELFSRVEARFERIATLSYQVQRTVSTPKERSEDQWRFRFSKPESMRVDYQRPHERTLIFDGKTLVEYLPTARKARVTDVTAFSTQKRQETIRGAFERVAVAGLHLGDYQEMSRRAVGVKTIRWAGVDAYLVEGEKPRYAVYIDKAKMTLLRTVLYDDEGNLTVRTDAADSVEAASDLWLPREIKATFRTAAGFVNTLVKLSEIKINEPLATELFRFDAPQGVSLVTP